MERNNNSSYIQKKKMEIGVRNTGENNIKKCSLQDFGEYMFGKI